MLKSYDGPIRFISLPPEPALRLAVLHRAKDASPRRTLDASRGRRALAAGKVSVPDLPSSAASGQRTAQGASRRPALLYPGERPVAENTGRHPALRRADVRDERVSPSPADRAVSADLLLPD